MDTIKKHIRDIADLERDLHYVKNDITAIVIQNEINRRKHLLTKERMKANE